MLAQKFRTMTRVVVQHQRELLSFSLLAGFIIDAFTLRRLDLLVENIILLTYLGIAGVSIALNHYFFDRGGDRMGARYARAWLPLITQFVFGGLFSAFLIFYSKSASLWASWPFLLLIVAVMVGNEVLVRYQSKLAFQVSIYYFALFSFSIFVVPILMRQMGAQVFLMSGVLSLALIGLYLALLRLLHNKRFLESAWPIRLYVVTIFVMINILYFSNIIPPIPLAMKELGVYHSVAKQDGVYLLTEERREWWDVWRYRTIHVQVGEVAYVFGSVFAPTALKTEVTHVWDFYDPSSNTWIEKDTVSFSIVGGRDGGYRGYTLKRDLEEGLWRVNIESNRGQLIGRIHFRVVRGVSPVPLITVRS